MKEFSKMCDGIVFDESKVLSDLRVWIHNYKLNYSAMDEQTGLRDMRTNYQFIWVSDKEVDTALEADRIGSVSLAGLRTKRRGL